MAINYLNTVNLNKNQLEQAAIQNLAVEPTPDTPGQIYFNTVSQTLRITEEILPVTTPKTYKWVEVGGGIEGSGTINTIPKFTPGTETIGDSSITDNGTTVNFSGSLISLDDANNADAIISAPGKMFIELDNDNSGTDERFEIRTTVAGNKAARLSIDDDGNTAVLGGFTAGASATIVGDIDVQGGTLELGGTDTRIIKGKDVPEIAGNTPGLSIETGFVYGTDTAGPNLTISAGQSTGTANGGGIVFKVSSTAGSSGSATNALATALTISGSSGDAIFTNGIQVDSDSIMYGDLTMDATIAMSNNKITGLLNPTAAQDAATKAYVDSAVTGLLQFQGGFNANTGDIVGGGNLTSGATRVAVAVGDYYVVTVDGNFFGNAATPLTVGDSVIVQTAAAAGASVEADFIVVQSDTDLATLATVGLGNVNASGEGFGIEGISVAYSSGTATVGLDIYNLTEVTSINDNALSLIPIFDDNTGQNAGINASNLFIEANTATTATGTITAGNLAGTVTHAFGVNTIVQTLDSSGNTVYCDISRTATTSVATITAVQATDITILVQKIG